jgi:ABC-2 type transport system ATP-binding protein
MAEAQELCNQVAVIRQGQLVTVGHPDELRARSGAPRVEITGRGFSPEVLDLLRARPGVVGARARNGTLVVDLRPGTEAAPLISLLVGTGAEIEEVHRDKASLQEVFLTLTEEDRA